MILSAVLTVRCSLLISDLLADPNHTVIEEHMDSDFYRRVLRLNNSRVKLCHVRLWQVELFQLTKKVHSLLGLFHDGVDVSVPLQVLRDGGSQEPEWLHCIHRVVHDSEWGRAGGFLLKSTIISTVLSVLSSRLFRLHQTASSLTSCL